MQRCNLSITTFIALSYGFLLAADPLVVHLTPPYVDESDFVVRTACNRPRRSEGINISLEQTYTQTILHCYGHGGSGFTTLFGSIHEAVQLLLAHNPPLDTPTRIIGSGCMGLTMAIELYRQGFTNLTISTKERYNLPSWRAGGFFDPGTGSESSPQDVHQLNLGLITHEVLCAIKEGRHPYLGPDIVDALPIYYPANIECEVEVLEKLNLVPASELVTLDFGNGVMHEGYKRQMTYFIHVTKLMKRLWAIVESLEIPVVDEEIASFADCSESIICNCSGIGSRTLNNDAAVYPGRGHFFMLRANAQTQPLDYMFFTKVEYEGRKDFIYYFPKSSYMSSEGEMESAGMLGGTSIPCTDLTDEQVQQLDDIEYARLAERAHAFFYGA